jgi:hypothetical protein
MLITESRMFHFIYGVQATQGRSLVILSKRHLKPLENIASCDPNVETYFNILSFRMKTEIVMICVCERFL